MLVLFRVCHITCNNLLFFKVQMDIIKINAFQHSYVKAEAVILLGGTINFFFFIVIGNTLNIDLRMKGVWRMGEK